MRMIVIFWILLISASCAEQSSSTQASTTQEVIVPLPSNTFVSGGNSFGTEAQMGTLDNKAMSLITNSTPRISITSSGQIGINNENPEFPIHIRSDTNSVVMTELQGNTAGAGPAFIGRRARLSGGVPSSTLAGDLISSFGGRGYLGSDWADSNSAQISILAEEDHTGTGRGSYIQFETTETGTATRTPKMFLMGNGNVGLGATPGPSSLLELSSTTKAFVLPRMTQAQRNAIASPVAGMMIYQTNNIPGLRVFNGTNWMRFTEAVD